MSEIESQILSGVPETLLLPLYNRAMESQRPDAMLKDEKAVELVTQMRLDFSQVRQIPMPELLKVMLDGSPLSPVQADTHLSLPAWRGICPRRLMQT